MRKRPCFKMVDRPGRTPGKGANRPEKGAIWLLLAGFGNLLLTRGRKTGLGINNWDWPMQGLAMAMKDAEPVVAKAGAERRRFRRVKVDLPGRLFIPADSREARCTINDLSPGGAAITCEIIPEAGTPVVLYVDSFGRFEGNVVRRDG